tara:strand:+ start:1463 stop:2983 length:1521 start_codon:yes stop_codon:yes gene_type:complete
MIQKGIDLLVIAPSAKKLYQKLANDFSAKEPNIWAGLLANVARKSGYEVNIYDLEVENPSEKDFLNIIETFNPKLILIVVTGQNPNASTAAMSGAVETSDWIKNNAPNYKIAFVGPHMSALPIETLSKHSSIDFVFTNEGVYTLLEILQTNYNSSDLKKVKGLCFRDEDFNIILNKPSKIVPQDRLDKDLSGIAYDLMPNFNNYRTSSWHANYIDNDRSPFASIYTSLGCIFKCEFCMINIINRNDNDSHLPASHFNTFRYWPPEFTIKQLDFLAKAGVKQLKIADEMWVLNPKHFLTLCDLIIERRYDFNIWAYTRIDTIKPKYLDKLKKAGVNWLAPGIEAGNQTIRQEITKGKFKDVNIREIVSLIQNFDINVGANYIFGLGNDNWDTMQETLNLAIDLNTENANMYCSTPLPGSSLYLQGKREGWVMPTKYNEFGFLSYEHIPSRTKALTSSEILKFRDYAFHVYFEHPKFLNMINKKFGASAVNNIKRMTKIKLKRKLLEI